MNNINYIMNMLDWNNSAETQIKGRELARELKDISIFLQPNFPKINKNVWDNCAIILSEKTDDELYPYLINLLEWLQDLNWPGALCVLKRLQKYKDKSSFNLAFNECVKHALYLKDDVWLANLQQI